MAQSKANEHSLTDNASENMECISNSNEMGDRVEAKVEPEAGPANATQGIDRLLQEHRKEIMFELRRLQLGNRPVTGQENRKNVEDFFLRSLDPELARESSVEHRPEQVCVEVQGLVERRPVSSLLLSRNFRRQLENTLRGSFAGASATSRRQPAIPVARRAPPHTSSVSETAAVIPEMTPQVLSQPILVPQSETQSTSTESSYTSMEDDENMIPSPLVSPLPEIEPVERAEAWLRQQQQPTLGNSSSRLWNSLEQGHRDTIISEISELVQQQLVTSTLHGDFRSTLEVTMNNQLAASGTDGQHVRQVINNLPRFPVHMRNNFSDLGILSGPNIRLGGNLEDLSDTVSVISATAAVTIPQSQSTMVMTREIGSLKTQIAELKQMMSLSFDLQLDIQRAIRQEVTAAVNAAVGSTPAVQGASCSAARASKPVDSSKCVICLDKGADAVLYKCGHLCLCYICGVTLRQRNGNCPVCRAPIVDIIRAYTVGNTD